MNWLEISLTVEGELAEAVADVLARFAPNGVVTEQAVGFLDEEDEGSGTGPITVRAYLEVNDNLDQKRNKIEESLHFLGMIQPVPPPVYKQVADQNWMEAWKQHYQPIRIGRRLLILPAWMNSPDPGRIPIRIDPGMAFGTGTHPSTQLCLELMEEHFERCEIAPRYPPSDQDPAPSLDRWMIDVGCGSGILSIAGIKLGASRALGVDTDAESVKNARENAKLNDIKDEFITRQGSVAEVLQGMFPCTQAPLVVANILAPVIIRLLDAGLGDLVLPEGEILLSGILDHQAGSVIEAAQAKGLKLNSTRKSGDWVALSMKR